MIAINRKNMLAEVKRVVIKVGSAMLTRRNGLNLNLIDDLSTEICTLRRKGIEVILVSSGAIAAGLRKIGITKKPDSLSQLQALAAMGQSHLIMAYEEAFARHGAKAAQLLLTRDDLTHRRRYLNARNTLLALLAWKIIPIINENDTVVVEEIKFGDNDSLSAMVTNLTESKLFINLTHIDGLYDKDPRQYPEAALIPVVEKVDCQLSQAPSANPGVLGTGGIATKLAAAKTVAMRGIPSIIANGLAPGILKDIFAGKNVGTLFMPRPNALGSRKHWIAFTQSPKGGLTIDPGAEKALVKNGKSLLPKGIKSVSGRFSMGNSVVVRNAQGQELAIGMVNYHSGDLKRIIGVNSSEIESILGYKPHDEVIHRDNLILAAEMDKC